MPSSKVPLLFKITLPAESNPSLTNTPDPGMFAKIIPNAIGINN